MGVGDEKELEQGAKVMRDDKIKVSVPISQFKNKKIKKKVDKLKDLAHNAFSYLQIVRFKILVAQPAEGSGQVSSQNSKESNIETLVEGVLRDSANLKLAQLKVFFTHLRDE